jgi:hypothetical protein
VKELRLITIRFNIPIKGQTRNPLRGQTHPVKISNMTTMGFNVNFKTNLFLLNFIGLGKGVSKGYGIVLQKRK